MIRPRTWVLAIAVVGGLTGTALRAQVPSGGYVCVDTWRETATALPAAVWNEPSGIDLGPSGRICVADRRLRRVQVLENDGRPVVSFGRGTAPEDLVVPEHLAVDETRDRVYVADPGGARIAVYDTAGVRLDLWLGIGLPQGIAVAPDGRVVVTDAAADRVLVLAPDGRQLAAWGAPGSGPLQFDRPAGLDVTPTGEVWVGDRGNARLVVTTLDGRPIATVALGAPALGGGEPRDVAADGFGTWVATDAGLAVLDADPRARARRGFLANAPAAAVTVDTAEGAVAEAAAAKAQSVRLFTVGLEEDVDPLLLARIATRPAYAYAVPGAQATHAAVARIAELLRCAPEDHWPLR